MLQNLFKKGKKKIESDMSIDGIVSKILYIETLLKHVLSQNGNGDGNQKNLIQYLNFLKLPITKVIEIDEYDDQNCDSQGSFKEPKNL